MITNVESQLLFEIKYTVLLFCNVLFFLKYETLGFVDFIL